MGRKAIPVSQRAQPISFSLKPHLIEKIDDYCHDHRFNRSKFLMEAVTQYMLKNDMGYTETNVRLMGLNQRVAIGLAALQEANREGETIPKAVMDSLRNELGVADIKHVLADAEPSITFHKSRAGRYEVYNHGTRIATIIKEGSKSTPWVLYVDDEELEFRTLAQAQDAVEGMWE